jgi:hypothetical protein
VVVVLCVAEGAVAGAVALAASGHRAGPPCGPAVVVGLRPALVWVLAHRKTSPVRADGTKSSAGNVVGITDIQNIGF